MDGIGAILPVKMSLDTMRLQANPRSSRVGTLTVEACIICPLPLES